MHSYGKLTFSELEPTAINPEEHSLAHRETSTLEEPIDEDYVLGIREMVEEEKESEQQEEITQSESVQSLQLSAPAPQISESSQFGVSAAEEMGVEDNTLMVPSELADVAMENLQMIKVIERDANSRNEGLVINEDDGKMLDNEDEEMPVLTESREAQESKEEEDRDRDEDSPDCRIVSSSDSKSQVSERSVKDGSRLAHMHRGSATSQSTVNASASAQGIIINENERRVQGMFDIESGSRKESHGRRAEERIKKTEYHSRHRSHRSDYEFEECLFMS